MTNRVSVKVLSACVVLSAVLPLGAQTCQTRDDIPAQTRAAIEAGAQQTFDQSSRGDIAGLVTNSDDSLKANFGGVAAAVTDNHDALAGAVPQVRASFLLDTGDTPSPDGQYLCGAFSANGPTAGSAEFVLPGLKAGRYAIVIQDLTGGQAPLALTTIFQESGGWKLAGLYLRPTALNGHDGIWHMVRAREFKAKGQMHNAWFYYLTAMDLLAPVRFMDSKLISKISQESTALQPKDVPAGGKTLTFTSGGKTWSVTDMSVLSSGNGYSLSIRYSTSDVTDVSATQAEARTLGTAYAAQNPELKDAFDNVVVHAVDAGGRDVPGVVALKSGK